MTAPTTLALEGEVANKKPDRGPGDLTIVKGRVNGQQFEQLIIRPFVLDITRAMRRGDNCFEAMLVA